MKSDGKGQDLTNCEKMIMKTIWNAGGNISAIDLREQLKRQFNKDYARTTMSTFLLKLAEKGYVKNYRDGKNSYTCAIKTEEEYKKELMKKETDFWFSGSVASFVSALCSSKPLSKEEEKEIRGILDGMGDD